MTIRRSVFVGTGSYLPERVVTNDDLAKIVDTSDEWIVSRSGIRVRHFAAEHELTSDLAGNAAQAAIDAAGLKPTDIDLIVVATTTPDQTFPATATTVQANLGITEGFAFDLQAVCSGFIYSLVVADNFIRSGQVERALVIGAETFSRLLDWDDRSTCVLFGDGAGAVVLEARDGAGDFSDRGILCSKLHSDGRFQKMLYVDGGPSSTKTTGHVRMEGREVFKHAVRNLTSVCREVLDLAGLQPSDIDWVIPHQANKRILDGTIKKLDLPPEKMVMTIEQHANTSAASVPLALDVAVRDGRIKPGDLLLLEAMGGGFTWGACVVRW